MNAPPRSGAIPLGWAQLEYSLADGKEGTTTYGTVRGLQSAAALYFQWDMQQRFSGRMLYDKKQAILTDYSLPTDDMVYTLQNSGLARRIGDEVKPSWPLLW